MADAPRTALARLGAWFRRGWDAELLALAPATDEAGDPLVWDFPHPVNRSPAWRLLRPWVLLPGLMIVLILVAAFIVPGALPALADVDDLAFLGILCAFMSSGIHGATLPWVRRAALRAYRRYRWRGTRALDVAMAAALDHERTPKRLVERAPTADDGR